MQRIKLFLIIAFLTTTYSNAQYFEGFQGVGSFPSIGWSKSNNGVGNGNQWGPTGPAFQGYESVYAAMGNRENIGIGNTSENWLVTPGITIGSGADLSFYCRQTLVGNGGTKLQIKVSTASQTDHATFSDLIEYSELNMPSDLTWQQFSVSLNQYAGQTIYIAFIRKHTQLSTITDGDRFIVDEVSIPNGLLQNEVFENEQLSIYPNPVTTDINVTVLENSKIQSIRIYNTLGQVVLEIRNPQFEKSTSINVASFKTGTYFLELISDKGKSTKKFIKL